MISSSKKAYQNLTLKLDKANLDYRVAMIAKDQDKALEAKESIETIEALLKRVERVTMQQTNPRGNYSPLN